MQEVVLEADLRKSMKKHAKYSRAKDMIPGVYYAHGEGNINIEVPKLSLEELVFTSQTRIIDLHLKDGTSKKCILRDVQFDPVSDKPIHFDLQGLKENERLTVEIPVTLVGGVPAGVRDGGMLQQFVHKLKISCLPKDMPQRIEIQVAELGINHFVHVSDITMPNITILDNAENAVVGVMPPHIVKEEVPAEAVAEEVKEPEVVGKGKKVEEGAEGADAAAKEKKAEAPAKEKKEEKQK
jgi:large subunit ribosomal protein L25